MRWILAVDPGGNTGFAFQYAELYTPMEAGQLPVENFLDWARDLLSTRENWLVVCERFTITAKTATLSAGGSHDALDAIGVLKYLCRWHGHQFEFQTPGQAKRFVPDAQLRALGLWKPGQDHARDAIRHLVFGVVNHTRGTLREDFMQRLAG